MLPKILLLSTNMTFLFIFSVILVCHKYDYPFTLEPNTIKPSHKGYPNVPFVAEILLLGINTTFLFIFSVILVCHKYHYPFTLEPNPIKSFHKDYPKCLQKYFYLAQIRLLYPF